MHAGLFSYFSTLCLRVSVVNCFFYVQQIETLCFVAEKKAVSQKEPTNDLYRSKQLLLGLCCCRCSGLCVFFLELFHPAFGVKNLLLSGIKGVAF
jgi:hypothetical protein